LVNDAYKTNDPKYCKNEDILENLVLPLKPTAVQRTKEQQDFVDEWDALMEEEEKIMDSQNRSKFVRETQIAAISTRLVLDTPDEGKDYKIETNDEAINDKCFLKATSMGIDYFNLGAGADKKDASTYVSMLLRTFRDLITAHVVNDPRVKDFSLNLMPGIKSVFVKNEVKLKKKVNGILKHKLPRTIINDNVLSLCICYLLFFEILEDTKKTQMDGNGIGVSNFHGGPEQIFKTMFKRTNLHKVEEKIQEYDKKKLAHLFDWFSADVQEWDKSMTAGENLYICLKMFLKIDWQYLIKKGRKELIFVYSLFMYFQRWFIGNVMSLTKDRNAPLVGYLGTMASGTYLTAFGNSEVNNLKATTVQAILTEIFLRQGGDWQDTIIGSILMYLTYGDDLILAFLRELRDKMKIDDRQFGIIVKMAYRMVFKDDFVTTPFFTVLNPDGSVNEFGANFLKNYFVLLGDSIYTYRADKDIIPKIFVTAQNVSSTKQQCVRAIGLALVCGQNKKAYDICKMLYDQNKPKQKVMMDARTLDGAHMSFKVAGITKELVNKELFMPDMVYIASKQILDWQDKINIDNHDEAYMERHLWQNW